MNNITKYLIPEAHVSQLLWSELVYVPAKHSVQIIAPAELLIQPAAH
jgi:hypothetical protein